MLLVLLMTGLAAAPGKTKIAINELEAGVGVDAKVAHLLSSTVTSELRRLPSLSVVSQDEIKSLLGYQKQRQLLNCGDADCLAEIGGALGAEQIVTGSLSQLGQTYVFILRRVEVRRAKVLRDVERRFKVSAQEALLDAVPGMLRDLFPGGRALSDDAVGAVAEVHKPGPAPWIVAAGGGAVAIAGLVLLIAAIAHPSPPTYPEAQSANLFGDLGQGLLIGGGVVAAGGLVWGLARPNGESP